MRANLKNIYEISNAHILVITFSKQISAWTTFFFNCVCKNLKLRKNPQYNIIVTLIKKYEIKSFMLFMCLSLCVKCQSFILLKTESILKFLSVLSLRKCFFFS